MRVVIRSGVVLMTDTEIIDAFKSGDELAFALLYGRYKTGIYTYCLKMLLDREEALDAVQDTFLRVYENRSRLLSTPAFRSWLFTIARNQCLNRLRHSGRHVRIEGRDTRLVAAGGTPLSRLEKAERRALVNKHLEMLRPAYREVVILREYHNLSYEEIAAVTRTTVSSVKSRLFKARRRLAASLSNAIKEDKVRVKFGEKAT